MRIEKSGLISMNEKLAKQLEIALEALKFYSDGKHYDTIMTEKSFPYKVTRLLDNGAIAEEAQEQIKKV